MTTPESTQPDLLPPKPRTVYQVMWKLKHRGGCWPYAFPPTMWHALEEEVWGSHEAAELRLKHYQKSTLSRVLEFKVEPGQVETR